MATYPSPTLQDLTVNGTATLTDVSSAAATITGGTIDGTPIGATTPAAVHATTINSTGSATLASVSTASATLTGGTVDGVTIGGTTPEAIHATTLSASGTVSGTGFTNLLAPYPTDAILAAPGGSALIGYLQSGTGAVARTVQGKLSDTIYALDFGAKFDGGTDDTTAVQAGLNYLASIGGGTLICPTGKTVISATLTINSSNVSILGQGRGGFNDSGTADVAATQFQWAGAAGIPMLSVYPTGTQALRGCNVDGIQFLGNGTNMASHGLLVSSCSQSLHRISGSHFSTAVLAYTITSGLSEASDCQYNDIWVTGYQELSGEGSIFLCDSPTVGSGSQGNFSANRVWQAQGNHFNGDAHVIKGADNNDFYLMTAFRVGGGAGYGVTIEDSTSRGSQANMLYHVSTGAGVRTIYTTHPSTYNNILFYDIENGSPTPVIQSGCQLWWGSNHGPNGMRVSTPGTNDNQLIYADGRIRYSGFTSAIAANGNVTITFPTAFVTSTISAQVTPIVYSGTTAVTCGCAVTNTGITIYNTSASSNSFWWSVEGY